MYNREPHPMFGQFFARPTTRQNPSSEPWNPVIVTLGVVGVVGLVSAIAMTHMIYSTFVDAG